MTQIEKDVLNVYTITKSIKATAREFGFSHAKVRKILITHGKLDNCELAEKIKILRGEGLSDNQITERLNISSKVLNNYLPYSKGIYNNNLRPNAKRIKIYRESEKAHENGAR